MNVTRLCLAILVIGQMLAGEYASAGNQVGLAIPRNARVTVRVISTTAQSPAASNKRQTASRRVRKSRRSMDRGDTLTDIQAVYAANLGTLGVSAIQGKRVRRDAQANGKVAAREQSERDSRAERLYRSSQLSAPIITDAKACKRIGARGESIYENCQLAPASTAKAN